jgi:hypothetical protein
MHGCFLAITGLALTASASLAKPYDVDWYTVDAGRGYSSALTFQGLFELSGTIGQPDASDELTSPDGYSLVGGFWANTSAAPFSDIDFNNNGSFPEDQDVTDDVNVLAGGTCSNG